MNTQVSFSIDNTLSKYYGHCCNTLLNYSKADYVGMCGSLVNWEFGEYYISSDVERIWTLPKTAISDAIQQFVPLVNCCWHHINLLKWFDQSVCHNIKCLSIMHHIYTAHPAASLLRRVTVSQSFPGKWINSKSLALHTSWTVNLSKLLYFSFCSYAWIQCNLLNLSPFRTTEMASKRKINSLFLKIYK